MQKPPSLILVDGGQQPGAIIIDGGAEGKGVHKSYEGLLVVWTKVIKGKGVEKGCWFQIPAE